jgi:hypothetical protein
MRSLSEVALDNQGTCQFSLKAEHLPSKQTERVRFPQLTPIPRKPSCRPLGRTGVLGSRSFGVLANPSGFQPETGGSKPPRTTLQGSDNGKSRLLCGSSPAPCPTRMWRNWQTCWPQKPNREGSNPSIRTTRVWRNGKRTCLRSSSLGVRIPPLVRSPLLGVRNPGSQPGNTSSNLVGSTTVGRGI